VCSGYGVELLLKSLIADRKYAGMWSVSDINQTMRTHNLEELLKQPGQYEQLRFATKNNHRLAEHWLTI